ncbi:hypothetical protein LQW54_001869 [Pestalotiopsis sp. IQ-011]
MAPNIPPEVTLMILGYIMHGPKQSICADRSSDMSSMVMGAAHEAPMYAAVSRTWQDVIERETFRELRLDLDRLKHWESIMTPRRRGYVTIIHLDVLLPRYFDAAWAQVETEEEQRQNNLIATATIKEFIEQLSTWKKEDVPAGHILSLWMHAYSPSDEGHWTREEWKDRRAWPGTKWPQIYEKRYENSVLELIDLDASRLSEVFAISHIRNDYHPGRHVAPALVSALIGRLRNVRKATFVAWDDPKESSERRHRIRTGEKQQCDFNIGLK